MSQQKMREALDAICSAKLCSINSMSSRVEMLRLMDLAIDKLREALAEPSGHSGEFGEGMSLVPSRMVVTPEALEALQCVVAGTEADNADAPLDERWLTAVLFVGEATDDEGNKVHGLHAYSDEYPEEGCTTLVAFPAHEAKRVMFANREKIDM